MPCRCDGMETPPQKDPKHEHIKACKAQSLVHKLAFILEKNNIPLSREIKNHVSQTRKELLAHKRQEHDEDVVELKNKLSKLERDIREIKKLGGEPKQSLLDQVETYKANIINGKMSDDELLGNDEY